MIKLTKMNRYIGQKLYKKGTYELSPGLYILVGRNGIGKTTFLRMINDYCDQQDIPCKFVQEDKNRGPMSLERLMFSGEIHDLANYFMASEGQRIYVNLGRYATSIGKMLDKADPSKPIVFMLDGIDSGMDIQLIEDTKDLLHNVEKKCKERNLEYYILTTANNYAFCDGEKCFDVANLKQITFNSYLEYTDFIHEQYRLQHEASEKEAAQNAK